MTNNESAKSAVPYTSAEVSELTAWSRQDGWAPVPATVHRLLATVERLMDDRAAVLREALDAVPQDICTHDGCEETTCPLTRVNVAISALLDKDPRA